MDYTQLTAADVGVMLRSIGVDQVQELFRGIDEHGLLDIPAGLSEPEMLSDLDRLAEANTPTDRQISFLGGGIYDHFIPTIVEALALKGEFLTAYTPYQAEASQGILQAFYEFQTMVCELTGMDVANASLYEVASATAEAVYMANSINGRPNVLVAQLVHPDIRRVLDTYTSQSHLTINSIDHHNGQTPIAALSERLNEHTAAVVVQHPSYLGTLEDIQQIQRVTREAGAVLIVACDPISTALLKRPGDYGADIVVAEGQALGVPQSFGGPVLGLMATRKQYLRKMPGRIVGRTVDRDGRAAYCLTLQAREQHIRREKASSNICTNQGLLAMRATVYLAAVGKRGLAEIARQCCAKAHYAAQQISDLPAFDVAFEAPFFKEFVVRSSKDVSKVLARCLDNGILAGIPLRPSYVDLDDCFLVAVTERRTRAQIDRFVEVLGSI